MTEYTFPPSYPHGDLEEVFPNIYFVTGTVRFPGPLPIRFSRNMVVIKNEASLTLVNTVRLDDAGLTKLDGLGKVEHIIRVAGFHGMDDPFYKDRYGAQVWTMKGQVYAKGFDNLKISEQEGYFHADQTMDAETELPFSGARAVAIEGRVAEGLLYLERDGGILIAGDALQNWAKPDAYFSFPAKIVMKLMGFMKPCNVGPGWLKEAKPNLTQLKGLLDLEFTHVLPSHGAPVVGDAKTKFRPAIERACS